MDKLRYVDVGREWRQLLVQVPVDVARRVRDDMGELERPYLPDNGPYVCAVVVAGRLHARESKDAAAAAVAVALGELPAAAAASDIVALAQLGGQSTTLDSLTDLLDLLIWQGWFEEHAWRDARVQTFGDRALVTWTPAPQRDRFLPDARAAPVAYWLPPDFGCDRAALVEVMRHTWCAAGEDCVHPVTLSAVRPVSALSRTARAPAALLERYADALGAPLGDKWALAIVRPRYRAHSQAVLHGVFETAGVRLPEDAAARGAFLWRAASMRLVHDADAALLVVRVHP
jgi:hypothetical protein